MHQVGGRLRVLILGGTTEASALMRALAADPRFHPILSLAGRTIAPVLPEGDHRIGGFGGVDGLVGYLQQAAIDLLIDATHPFAARMTAHAAAAVRCQPIPLLRIERAPWQPVPGDRWIEVATMTAAAEALGPPRRRVLLTIGQQELAPFRAAPWHDYVIRCVDPPAASLTPPGAVVITARGPFEAEGERALLQSLGIERLVTKNSGGIATAAKLTAARALGIPVIMVRRPAVPVLPVVTSVAEALAWLEAVWRDPHAASARRGV